MENQQAPTQRIDRSRPEARWMDGADGASSVEWCTDSEWVNVYCRINVGNTVAHVNNWIRVEQMEMVLSTMGKLIVENFANGKVAER